MNILSLEARDFRSLQNIRWEPGNLNVLIGPNGSGKTNLVLFLKLIAQSAQGKLSDSILRLGGSAPYSGTGNQRASAFSSERRLRRRARN